jgi:voltage-gated potassium channel
VRRHSDPNLQAKRRFEVRATLRVLGDRYNAFVYKYEIAWELLFAALAFIFVGMGFVVDAAIDAHEDATALLAVELSLWAIFVAEFTSRFAAARDRRAYLRGHWIDAVALIPAARAFRLLRILRLLRLFRAFAGIFRALGAVERFTSHRTLIGLFIAWLSVAVICGAAFYFAEVDFNPQIQTPVDALWWAITTLTTVGYGDVYPLTPEGRLAGSALMIVGITLWAAVTGTITSLLVINSSSGGSIPEQIRQLGELRRDDVLTESEFDAKKTELLASI